MKIFTVVGVTKSGKTSTIEEIIRKLKNRRYSVGSVKEIHFEKFTLETEGTNTYRHKVAGSELVTARGFKETDVLFPERIKLDEILKFYHHDFVVLEGVMGANVPKIITAAQESEIEERLDDTVFAISGKISNTIDVYKGIPVINTLKEPDKLIELIEEKVYEKLPDFPWKCCHACGYGCRELGKKILRGEAKREDCVLSQNKIKLTLNDQDIPMVPFVQNILLNAVKGVIKELEGYHPGIKVKIDINNEGVEEK